MFNIAGINRDAFLDHVQGYLTDAERALEDPVGTVGVQEIAQRIFARHLAARDPEDESFVHPDIIQERFRACLARGSEEPLFVAGDDQSQERVQRFFKRVISENKGFLYCFSTEEPEQFFELLAARGEYDCFARVVTSPLKERAREEHLRFCIYLGTMPRVSHTSLTDYRLDIIPKRDPFRHIYGPPTLYAILRLHGTIGDIFLDAPIPRLVHDVICDVVSASRRNRGNMVLDSLRSLVHRLDMVLGDPLSRVGRLERRKVIFIIIGLALLQIILNLSEREAARLV